MFSESIKFTEWISYLQGDKGDKGDTGAKGLKGHTGHKGDQVRQISFYQNYIPNKPYSIRKSRCGELNIFSHVL